MPTFCFIELNEVGAMIRISPNECIMVKYGACEHVRTIPVIKRLPLVLNLGLIITEENRPLQRVL